MSQRCRNGGPAPCIDDMCHNCTPTLCGLYLDDDEDDDFDEGLAYLWDDDGRG